MESGNKLKIIIIASVGLAVLLVVFLFVRAAGSKKNKPEEIAIRSDVKSDFTIDDMMSVNNKVDPTPRYSRPGQGLSENTHQTDPEVEILKEILKNKNTETNLTEEKEKPKAKTKPKTEEKTIVEQIVVPEKPKKKSRFFSAQESKTSTNTIKAVVHGEQTVENGKTLKLRILEEFITEEGSVIPKNTYVWGVVSFSSERLNVTIESIPVGNSIYPTKMNVVDLDGLTGISIPGNLGSEFTKELAEDVADEFNSSYNRDLISKGVSAITSAGKTVFRQNNRVLRVTVKSNYEVWLTK